MFLADKEESAYAMSRMDQTQMHLSSYVEAALDQKMNAMHVVVTLHHCIVHRNTLELST